MQILFITLLFYALPLMGAPHLMLYFDINKTLIASDKAINKTTEAVLKELFAEKHGEKWQEQKYTLQEYERTHATLNGKGQIFPSFYYLLDHLHQEGYSYTLILRSMGNEIGAIAQELNTHYGLSFQQGKFQNGVLHLEEIAPLSDPFSIYQQLRTGKHAAIFDDFPYWSAHGMGAEWGKPFYVDLEDRETLSIFFDDNIRDNKEWNIVAPLNAKTGQLLSIKELTHSRQLVRVNTLQAIQEIDYFLKIVLEALSTRELIPIGDHVGG